MKTFYFFDIDMLLSKVRQDDLAADVKFTDTQVCQRDAGGGVFEVFLFTGMPA